MDDPGYLSLLKMEIALSTLFKSSCVSDMIPIFKSLRQESFLTISLFFAKTFNGVTQNDGPVRIWKNLFESKIKMRPYYCWYCDLLEQQFLFHL